MPILSNFPSAGVITFNGRTGTVVPQSGDYTANMVGAIPNPSGGTTGQMLYKSADGVTWGDKPVMYVNITESGGTYSADKTFAEIQQAVNDGWAVFAALSSSHYIIPLSVFQQNAIANFVLGFGDSTLWVNISPDNSVVVSSVSISASGIDFNPGSGLTSDNVQDAIEELSGKIPAKPQAVSVTLTASAWSNDAQTVTVTGVLADETKQLIQPMPAVASQTAYMSAGIYCSGQAANSLTFTCSKTPTEDITLYVVITEVGV